MAGLPGKYEVHGDEVMTLFYNKEYEKIHEYCESDVLNTYMLYLKYELIKGNLCESDYVDFLNLMVEYLKKEKKHRNYVEIFSTCAQNEIEKFILKKDD